MKHVLENLIFLCFFLDLLPSDTLYKKDVRELEYGTYRLSLTAFMMIKTNTTEKEVPQTRNTIHGYFNITHCKLVAKFKGGNGQAVGQKSKLLRFPSRYLLFRSQH